MQAITANREKIDIIHDEWETEEFGRRKKISLRSNRILIPFTGGEADEQVVVRGKSLPGAVAMAVAVMRYYSKNQTVRSNEDIPLYVPEYKRSLSPFESNHIEDNWISVYIDGDLAYATKPHPEVDYLEQLSGGGGFDSGILTKAGKYFTSGNKAAIIGHDSQISLVINFAGKHVKAAILERNVRQDGKFSFTIDIGNDDEQKKIVLALTVAGYICEASAMLSMYKRLNAQLAGKANNEAHDLKKLMEIAKQITVQLRGQIISATKIHNLKFWPEPPDFVTQSITSYTANAVR